MPDYKLPERTADDLTLPNGDTVWVCTLNALFRDEVDDAARWAAQKHARKFAKGGKEYAELLSQVRAMTADQQCEFLADQQYPVIARAVAEEFPDPQKPEQREKAPEEFVAACVAWESDCANAKVDREAKETERYEAYQRECAEITKSARVTKCCDAYFTKEYTQAFIKRMVIETIYRATRKGDDHTIRYFASPEEFEDSDDATQSALKDFYFVHLDTVKQEEIPTSPVVS